MRATGIWAALLFCVVAIAAQRRESAVDAPVRFTVDGTLAGEPNTEIYLLDDSGSAVARALTGAGGRFQIQAPQEGHYRLAIRGQGGLSTLEDIALDTTEPNAFVNLTGRKPLPDLNQPLPPPGADAVIAARRLTEKVPGKARRLFDEAAKRIARGDEAGAIERLEKATVISPHFPEALNDLAVLYIRRPDPVRAEATLRRALALDPNAWRPHLNLGILFLNEKNYRAAQPELEQAEKLGPGSPLPPFHLGRLHAMVGDSRQAAACFTRALALQPQFPTAHLFRAYARLETGDLSPARADLVAYLEQAPQGANVPDVRRRLEEVDRTLQLRSDRR